MVLLGAGATLGGVAPPAAIARVDRAARFDRAAVLRAESASVGLPRTDPLARRARARAPLRFYVDALIGRDANSGNSPAAPWRTLARADAQHYRGGDRLLLRGGERFAGPLSLNPRNLAATSPRRRLTIGSYGGSVATIDARGHDGILVRNVAGVRITSLQLAGDGSRCPRGRSRDGILFVAAQAGTLAQGVAIDHVAVHGFCDGIAVGTVDDASRFVNVSVTESVSYDNADAGVMTFDPARRHHGIRKVRVAGVQAYRNDGTGGIALFGVDGGIVEGSVAYGNGRDTEGAVGIWAFDANRIVLQNSESYDNLTSRTDGDGFDLDGGVSHSVMQYDYSHGNQGAGFLVCACVGYDYYANRDNVVRYNVSQNDGGNGQPSGLFVQGGAPLAGLDVFNNSFYSRAGRGPLIRVDGNFRFYSGLALRNNLLAASAGQPLLDVPDPFDARGLAVQGNDWWVGGSRFLARWGTRRLHGLTELRQRTGLETLHRRPVGLSVDPQVCALGEGGTEYPAAPARLTAYALRLGSPLFGAGLHLASLFRTDVGTHDFQGNPHFPGSRVDVGADAWQQTRGC